MAFSLFKVTIDGKEFYEYGEHDFDAIEHAILRHGYSDKVRVSAKKVCEAVDLLAATRSNNEKRKLVCRAGRHNRNHERWN